MEGNRSNRDQLERILSNNPFPTNPSKETVTKWVTTLLTYIQGDGTSLIGDQRNKMHQLFIRLITHEEDVAVAPVLLQAFQKTYPEKDIRVISTRQIGDLLLDEEEVEEERHGQTKREDACLPPQLHNLIDELKGIYKDKNGKNSYHKENDEDERTNEINLDERDTATELSDTDYSSLQSLIRDYSSKNHCLAYMLWRKELSTKKYFHVLGNIISLYSKYEIPGERELQKIRELQWNSIPSEGEFEQFLTILTQLLKVKQLSEMETLNLLEKRMSQSLRTGVIRQMRQRGYRRTIMGYASFFSKVQEEMKFDTWFDLQFQDNDNPKRKQQAESDHKPHHHPKKTQPQDQRSTRMFTPQQEKMNEKRQPREDAVKVNVQGKTLFLSPNVKVKSCWKCGEDHSHQEKCRAKDHLCSTCHKTGHLEPYCNTLAFRHISETVSPNQKTFVYLDSGAQENWIGGNLLPYVYNLEDTTVTPVGIDGKELSNYGKGSIDLIVDTHRITIHGYVGKENKNTILLTIDDSIEDINLTKGKPTTLSCRMFNTNLSFERIGKDWVLQATPIEMIRRFMGISNATLYKLFRYSKNTNVNEFLTDLHVRLLHPCHKRLSLLFKERNLTISEDYLSTYVKCEVCPLLNPRHNQENDVPNTPTQRNPQQESPHEPLAIFMDEEQEDLERDYTDLHIFGETFHHDLANMEVGQDEAKFLSVIVDKNTNFLFLQALTKKSQAVSHMKDVVNICGIPRKVMTDNGGEFRGQYDIFLEGKNITHLTSAPGAPASNGKAEVHVRIAKVLIKRALDRVNLSTPFWPWVLNMVCNLHNIIPTSKGKSPYYLRWGVLPFLHTLPGDIVSFSPLHHYSNQKYRGRYGQYLGKLHKGGCLILERWPGRREELHVLHPLRVRFLKHKGSSNSKATQNQEDDDELEVNIIIKELSDQCIVGCVYEENDEGIHIGRLSYNGTSFVEVETMVVPHPVHVFKGKHHNHQYFLPPEAIRKLNMFEVRNRRNIRALQEVDTIVRPASKEEIKSGLFDQHDAEELLKIINMNALGEERQCDHSSCIPLVPVRTVYEVKGTIWKYKTRLAADGRKDKRIVDSYKGVPGRDILRMMIILSLSTNQCLFAADISSAYLHANVKDDVIIRLPNKLHQSVQRLGYRPGACYTLQKALYGLQDSGKHFIEFIEKEMIKKGYKLLHEGLFKKGDKYILFYVDDILAIGIDPYEELKDICKIEKSVILSTETGIKYLGANLILKDGKHIITSLKEYILSQQPECGKIKPFNASDIKAYDHLDNQDQDPNIRSILGAIGWCAQYNHRSAFTFSWACRNVNKMVDPQQTMKAIWSRIYHLEDECFTSIAHPEVRIHVDASYSRNTKRAHGGWLLQLADAEWSVARRENIILWRSWPLTRMFNSTTSAELSALLIAIYGVSMPVTLIRLIWGDIPVVLLGDSASAIAQVKKGHATNGGVEEIEAALAKQEITLRKWNVKYINTKENLADLLTKLID